MQRLAQELASLTSECAQLVQRKRALQQQQLLATPARWTSLEMSTRITVRPPLSPFSSHLISHSHSIPAAHASLADTEVTACLARAVFRLDEAQRRLRALRLARVGV
ncbi:hypothetical protein C8J57DRAFT_1534750 [Mycena rebaudengoi]|nr:hypothetical protein C8J57DRAFT_1534750 [Mycena rebaudengoi]